MELFMPLKITAVSGVHITIDADLPAGAQKPPHLAWVVPFTIDVAQTPSATELYKVGQKVDVIVRTRS